MSEENDNEIELDLGEDEEVEETPAPEEEVEEETSEVKEDVDIVVIPTAVRHKLEELLEKVTDLVDTESPSRIKWAEAVSESASGYVAGGVLDDAGSNETADWTNSPEYNGKELSAFEPVIRDVTGKKLSGDNAVTILKTKLGLGTKFSVPLWSSGIWVTLNTPSESDLLNLFIAIGNEKIEFGNSTAGTLFSNFGAVAHAQIAEFILDHLYATSCKGITADNLLEYVKISDFYTLVWGMTCAIYPNGFKYSTPCINNPEDCDYVATETIKPQFLLHVDKSKLTDKQLRHMSNRRPNSVDIEQVKNYQNTLEDNQSDFVTLTTENDSKVTFEIKQPSVRDHLASGAMWVTSVVGLLEGILTEPEANDDESLIEKRKNFIRKHAILTKLREYSHYVVGIEFFDNRIEDRPTIDASLDSLSSDEKLTESLLKEVKKYISKTTMSIVGIPEYDCPKCSTNQNPNPKERHPGIIPLDSLYYFFILTRRKVS